MFESESGCLSSGYDPSRVGFESGQLSESWVQVWASSLEAQHEDAQCMEWWNRSNRGASPDPIMKPAGPNSGLLCDLLLLLLLF